MNASAWGLLALFLALLLVLAWPLGRWMAALMEGRQPRWMRRVEAPLYRLAGVDPQQSMTWTHYALALLAFNAVGVLVVYALQRLQHVLPLNPRPGGRVARTRRSTPPSASSPTPTGRATPASRP